MADSLQLSEFLPRASQAADYLARANHQIRQWRECLPDDDFAFLTEMEVRQIGESHGLDLEDLKTPINDFLKLTGPGFEQPSLPDDWPNGKKLEAQRWVDLLLRERKKLLQRYQELRRSLRPGAVRYAPFDIRTCVGAADSFCTAISALEGIAESACVGAKSANDAVNGPDSGEPDGAPSKNDKPKSRAPRKWSVKEAEPHVRDYLLRAHREQKPFSLRRMQAELTIPKSTIQRTNAWKPMGADRRKHITTNSEWAENEAVERPEES